MSAILEALAPVAAIVALGWVLRHHAILDDGFWAPAETLTYYLLLPALFAGSLGRAHLAGLAAPPMALAIAGGLVLGAGVMLALRRGLGVDGPAFSSLFQGSIRPNSYIGIAVAFALYGGVGLALSAIAVATYVPLVNVLSVAVLSRHATRSDWGTVVRALVRNPLIIACLAGLVLNLSGFDSLPGLDAALDILGRAALALGLLCVGGALTFGGLHKAGRGLAAVCAVKLLLVPLATAAACRLLGVGGASATVAVLFTALPSATSAYILARQMGGDAPLMAQVIAATHLAAAFTLPFVLLIAA
ncbi:MAG: AEC family transporter [Alphaproteobacteria bacterium]